METLPTTDELFGPQEQLPTTDEFFAEPKPNPYSTFLKGTVGTAALKTVDYLGGGQWFDEKANALWESARQNSAVGRILGASIDKADETIFDPARLGEAFYNPEYGSKEDKDLRDAGIYQDLESKDLQIRKAITETVGRSSSMVLDAFIRTTIGATYGLAEALKQTSKELPSWAAWLPGMASEYIGSIPEGGGMGLHSTGAQPEIIADAKIRELRKGELRIPSPEKVVEIYDEATRVPRETPPEPQLDVHQLARQQSPEVFSIYDRLQVENETLRSQLSELSDQRTADIDTKINEIKEAKKGGYGRLKKLEAQRQEIVSQGDTPEMADLRSKIMKNDYAMRDVAPQVSEAYRIADEYIPKTVEEIKQSPKIKESLSSELEYKPLTPEQWEPQRANIVSDATNRIMSVGRSFEEAQAVAELEASRYKTLSEMFEGRKGTPEELYNRLSADVKAGRSVLELAQKELGQSTFSPAYEEIVRRLGEEESPRTPKQWMRRIGDYVGRDPETVGDVNHLYSWLETIDKENKLTKIEPKELTSFINDPENLYQGNRGKIRLAEGDAKSTITLFKNADASTLLHEKGHEWTNQILKYAKESDAPEQLKKDAQTIRNYVGATGEELNRRQNEKLARSFERYMMEGTAPNRELASVFAKFKQWLTDIYKTVQKLRAPINNDIRDVFDRLFTTNPEKTVIVPEQDLAKNLAHIHEYDAKTTPKEKAAEVRDRIREETDRLVKTKAPEIYDELTTGQTGELAPESTPTSGDVVQTKLGGETGLAEKSSQVGKGGSKTGPVGSRERGNSLYVKVPSRPPSLHEWIAKIGGIKDEGGELRAMDAHKTHLDLYGRRIPFAKKLVHEKGLSLDEAALRAEQAGYFPELGGERPTINQFLDKLNEDINGIRQYSEHDLNKLEQHNYALTRNEEVDKLAHDYNIDTTGLTYSQFWDKMAEVASREEQIKISESMEAEGLQAIEEAERKYQEFLSSRGDAWEPPKEAPQITLEELENERRQENIAYKAKDGSATTERPGYSGGNNAASETGIRQAGSSDKFTGNPSEPIRSRLIDKAGNIRLENLTTEESVREVMRQAADDSGDFLAARRGVVSDAEVTSLADAMGIPAREVNLQRLRDISVEDDIPLAVRIKVGRQMLVQSAEKAKELMEKAANGTDQDLVALAEARNRHLMIQETISGITAEWGRAGRAFRNLTKEQMQSAEAMTELFQRMSGVTPEQMKKIAKLGAKLDTPSKISRFLHDSWKPKFKDMAIEFWINGLLSGPATHLRNILSNFAVAANQVPETALAAGIGKIKSAFGAKERVYLSEAKADLFGLVQGSMEGLKAAKHAFKDEGSFITSQTIEQRIYQAIPSAKVQIGERTFELGGKQIRLPGRLLTAEDEFFKAIAYRQSLGRNAYRIAEQEGLKGTAFEDRVAGILENPSIEMMAEAKKNAEKQTFTNQLGKTGRAIQNFANSSVLAKLVIPFLRTPVNIVKYAGERSPFGLLSEEIRDNLMGKNGGVAQDVQISRMIWGTAIGVAAMSMASDGVITGGGPSDKNERSALRLSGWQQYSLKIGEHYYSYQWLEPFSTTFGIAADLYEIAKSGVAKDDEISKIGSMLFGSISKNLMSKLSLRGISDFINTATDPDRYGAMYVQQFAGSLVPNFIGQTARTLDPVQRQARTIIDSIKSRVPGYRGTLLPRRDVWGEPIVSQGAAGPDFLSPVYQSKISNDPVNQRLAALQFAPTMPDRKIEGVELTDQQYDDLTRLGGRLAKMRLNSVVGNPGFSLIPNGKQVDIIKQIVESSRKQARSLIMMQNPEIVKTIHQNKLLELQGKKPHK